MTALVVFKTPAEIVLASDSKRLSFMTHGGIIMENVVNKSAKIYRAGNLYFAFSGLTRDYRTGLDMPESIKKYLSGEMSFEDNVEQIKLGISNELKETYGFCLASGNEYSFSRLELHTLILAAFEGFTPKVSVITFRRTDDEGAFDITCDADHLTEEVAGWAIGKAALGYIEENPLAHYADKKEVAVKMIAAEINANPQSVGFPIHVMAIRPNCEPVLEVIPEE